MNILFLMDPWEDLIPEKDTTLLLMQGAQRRNHRVFYLPEGGITFNEGKFDFAVEELKLTDRLKDPITRVASKRLPEAEVDCIFIRTDPPFDVPYLTSTWLLDLLPKRIKVINSPNGIRTVNEKLWATQFSDLIPPTLITRDIRTMRDFLKTHKKIIIKPTNQYGGQSIFKVAASDPNANVIFETVSHEGNIEVICQSYIPEAKDGDKRILVLDGKPLGTVLRVHTKDDFRNNFFAGGKAHPTTVTKRDQEIIKKLAPSLKKLGLHFVGIDIIGPHLIEVNVTSPTCMKEMNMLNGTSLEDDVISFVEKLG